MDHLRRVKPRVIYIALDETDDWAHERNYARLLDSLAPHGRLPEGALDLAAIRP